MIIAFECDIGYPLIRKLHCQYRVIPSSTRKCQCSYPITYFADPMLLQTFRYCAPTVRFFFVRWNNLICVSFHCLHFYVPKFLGYVALYKIDFWKICLPEVSKNVYISLMNKMCLQILLIKVVVYYNFYFFVIIMFMPFGE